MLDAQEASEGQKSSLGVSGDLKSSVPASGLLKACNRALKPLEASDRALELCHPMRHFCYLKLDPDMDPNGRPAATGRLSQSTITRLTGPIRESDLMDAGTPKR